MKKAKGHTSVCVCALDYIRRTLVYRQGDGRVVRALTESSN